MDETTIGIIGSITALAAMIAIVSFIEHRVKTRGGLFTDEMSPLGHIAAALTGLGLLTLAWYLGRSGSGYQTTFVLAGLLCLAFAAGGIDSVKETARTLFMRHEPVPRVSQVDVERVVQRDYSPEQYDKVMALLDQYQGEGSFRVRLAALKLAAGDFEALRHQVEAANVDFRDVINLAEYPAYFTKPLTDPPDMNRDRQLFKQDWQQYQRWLKHK